MNTAASQPMFGSRVINQNAPHHHRRNGEKMGTAFPRNVNLFEEFEISLVNQSCSLERVSATFLLQVAMSLPVQFLIDEFKQSVSRFVAPIISNRVTLPLSRLPDAAYSPFKSNLGDVESNLFLITKLFAKNPEVKFSGLF